MTSPPGAERGPAAGGVIAVAILLTLWMAHPVLLRPGTRLFGSEIVGRHADPFIVIHQLENPRGLGVFTQPATDYLGAALAALTGDGVVAYNLLVLLSFPLATLFAYLLAFCLSRSRAVAWMAGLAYGFAPYHVAQSAYHPHGAQTQWLPLYLLSLWLCLGRANGRRLALLAAATSLVTLSNFYYGLVAAILTFPALAGFCLWHRERGTAAVHRNLGITTAALAALVGAGLAYVVTFARPVLDHPTSFGFDRDELMVYGARWWSYWTPPVEHPFGGRWAQAVWERHGLTEILEQQLTLGWGTFALAAVAVAAWIRGLAKSRGSRDRRLDAVPAMTAVAAVAFVCSLAPTGFLGSLRPSGWLYTLLPMFRAYARFGVGVFLAVAVLAGLGAAWLTRRSWAGRLAAVVLVTLGAIELAPFPPFRWRDVLPTTAHRWLEEEAREPVRVVDCVSRENRAEYPAYSRTRYEMRLAPGLADCGDPDFGPQAAARGFTHLLVRRASPLGGWLAGRSAPAGTRAEREFSDALLYRIDEPTQTGAETHLRIELQRGFHWREYDGEATYRWMERQGELTLVNQGVRTVHAALRLRLHAFPGPRTLEVEIDGAHTTELRVTTEPALYALSPLTLDPGPHRVVLRSMEPATVADSVLGNGDLRELTVALSGWVWEE